MDKYVTVQASSGLMVLCYDAREEEGPDYIPVLVKDVPRLVFNHPLPDKCPHQEGVDPRCCDSCKLVTTLPEAAPPQKTSFEGFTK
tara:strand:+ start:90 stop:347 length:258 start_codon:yes stop_codon:yes gene_type:complete